MSFVVSITLYIYILYSAKIHVYWLGLLIGPQLATNLATLIYYERFSEFSNAQNKFKYSRKSKYSRNIIKHYQTMNIID